MAVQISGDIPSPEDALDPHYVAAAFVEQYYLLLRETPEIVYKFYNDQSTIDRAGPDGEMTSVMTMQGINDKIMSSDYNGCFFEIINVDAQESLMGGVLVAVNGYFIGKEKLKKSFHQTFFLAKQEKGFFVLNDILRFVEVEAIESENLPTSNGTQENASDVHLTHDQETPDIPAHPKEVIDSVEKVSDVESEKKASDGGSGKRLSDVKTGTKASDGESSKSMSDINSEKNVSDITDTEAEVPNSSTNASDNESTFTHVASNVKQDPEKISYASMVAKESKVTSLIHNSSYKIVRVAANADQQSIAPAAPRDPGLIVNSAKKELTPSNGAAENNNAYADALTAKRIYIANLPSDITKSALIDALKIFGRVRPGGVQIRQFEDGFCFGFVEFESASAASKAVEVHNVTVGGNEAYMMYKKSGLRSSNGSGGNAGFRNRNFKGPENGEVRGNDGYPDKNQADSKSQARGLGGQDGETNQKSQSRAGRGRSRSWRTSVEWLPTGEAYWKNSQRRDDRGKSGDAYQKNKQQQQ